MPLSQGFPGHNAAAAFTDIRRDLEGSVVRDAAGKMRAGVFPAHFNALVTGRSDMKVAIADFRAVIDRGGAIFMANVGADTSVTLDAAPAANRRIDLIYATQQSTTLGDAASLPIFGFVKGTASATPVAPSLPANLTTALPLATVEIPAGATTTLSAGVVITQVFPYTAMAGGTVAVRNSVELAAWAPADGSKAYGLADARQYARASGAWTGTDEPVIPADFITKGTDFTIHADTRIYRRGKVVWGTLVLTSGVNFFSNQWLGNVAAAYLPAAAETNLSSIQSAGGTALIGIAALTRADSAMRNYTASTGNRKISIAFQWATV